jgi:peptidoglycan/xylan/chitin deacetylase (PgdA/CDA1 family)
MGRHSRPESFLPTVLVAVALVLSVGVAVSFAVWRSSAPKGVERAVALQKASPPASSSSTAALQAHISVAWTAGSTLGVAAETATRTRIASAAETTAQPPTSAVQPVAAAAPALPVFSAKRYLGTPVRVAPNRKREIALTFDDGPGPETERVLDILREHKIHATFFVVGRRARGHKQEVRDMAAQGHEVGNHTWNHPEPGSITDAALAKQFDRNQKLITGLTGQPPRFARTRGGKYSAKTLENLTSRGLILALWNIHSNDVEPSPSPEQIVRNATGGAEPGSIILMHETNPNTVEALPAILDALERKGLHPVTLSQLLADDERGSD